MHIPQDDGRARFLEAMILLAAMAVMSLVLGLAVGVPLAIIVNDVCASFRC